MRNTGLTRAIARTLAIGLVCVVAACAPMPQRAGIPTVWQPSPNFDARRANFVIIHSTASNTAGHALRTLTDPARKVSAHYLVARDGTIYQIVDERARAWHAGLSAWGADTDLNSASLGIELDNDGAEPFPAVQIDALLALLDDIAARHTIPAANYLGHGDIAPDRKVDPSAYFPWRALAQRGYGLWCDPPLPDAPADMDAMLALRAYGYDMSNADAALRAFKRHFLPDDMTLEWDPRARSMLYCLLQKKDEAGR